MECETYYIMKQRKGFVFSIKIDYLCEMKIKIINQNSSLHIPCFTVIYQWYFYFLWFRYLAYATYPFISSLNQAVRYWLTVNEPVNYCQIIAPSACIASTCYGVEGAGVRRERGGQHTY